MEKVKFNAASYDLVANGVQLTNDGGKIIFQPGTSNFETIKADIKNHGEITILDDAGAPILTRSDLIYAGRLALNEAYVIGSEDVTAEDGTTSFVDVTGPVMIAEFRTPDVREQLAETAAKLEYVAMMAGVETEE